MAEIKQNPTQEAIEAATSKLVALKMFRETEGSDQPRPWKDKLLSKAIELYEIYQDFDYQNYSGNLDMDPSWDDFWQRTIVKMAIEDDNPNMLREAIKFMIWKIERAKAFQDKYEKK